MTVPVTESLPMSPPGNSMGRTTWESVVRTRRDGSAALGTGAASRRVGVGVPKAGRKMRRMRSPVRVPPPPCARVTAL